MYYQSDNIEIIISHETDEIIKELFQSFLNRCQIGLETSMKVGDFLFDNIHALHYKCHGLSLTRDKSYIDSSD